MSPDLPARPSLEHLKKQARERLRELQVRVPDAQLADAQHAIAREYGFASWPRLKAHIKALSSTGDAAQLPARAPQPPAGDTGQSSPPDYGFDRYSERAKRATFFSRFEASQLGSTTIECEHLMLGVVLARQDLANARPSRFAPPIAELRSAAANRSNVMPALPDTAVIPFSAATKVVLARAAQTAASLGHQQISTGHLLMGLIRSTPSLAADILAQHQLSESSLLGEADAFLVDG